ncbi:MAG: hypothetical protein K6A34_02185 [Methanobrevibacter sp.]|nr:hypothetical protein [Methanobrevibacter sp.]
MDEFESLIGKSISDIDDEVIDAIESINIKVAILEYGYKNCRRRYPKAHFKLTSIDYNDLISFKELIDFNKICIIWYFNDIITDLEFFDITQDLDLIKKDYEYIKGMIDTNHAHNLRAGDTKYLAAFRLNEEEILNDRKINKRVFVFKKTYLQKMLNEIIITNY